MAMIKSFEDIEAWKDSRELVKRIYEITLRPSISNDYGFSRQIQRASVSIMSNIAEGFERGGNKEFMQFLWISKASIAEVRSLIYVALDLGYINSTESEALFVQTESLSRKISAFINYLKSSSIKGRK